MSLLPILYSESQNHRMIWVQSDFIGPSSPTPLQGAGTSA